MNKCVGDKHKVKSDGRTNIEDKIGKSDSGFYSSNIMYGVPINKNSYNVITEVKSDLKSTISFNSDQDKYIFMFEFTPDGLILQRKKIDSSKNSRSETLCVVVDSEKAHKPLGKQVYRTYHKNSAYKILVLDFLKEK